MGFRGPRSRRLFLAGGMFLTLFSLVSAEAVPFVQRHEVVNEALFAVGEDKSSREPANVLLAEMVQREDSVIYRTDGKDPEYQKREREEREKERKSWNMLNNVIIDGRQPPRRFSDPRRNDSPQ